MKIVSSYKARIYNAGRKFFQPTVDIYRSALSFLIDVYNREWTAIRAVERAKERFNFAEKLIHSTDKNVAKYDFDNRFPKMPSYLRRAAVQSALGAVSSYRSNHARWEISKKGDEPTLTFDRGAMPVFYKGEMYRPSDTPNCAYLKLFRNGDWIWVKVRLRSTDMKYIQKYWQHAKALCPTLERRYGKYCLRFAFEEHVKLSETPVSEQRICAVDLGLNTDAVCSIMCPDGTVLARKFIDFPSEKDHLHTVLNRIKRFQREHGSKNVQSFWKYAQRVNDELAKKVSAGIVDFAAQHSVDCIVFEHLDFRGKKYKGSKAQKLSMWRKNGIQNYVTHKAHRSGIRISRICAWGTSRLAFDGSGPLKRDEKNHALATFANGKQYNCDLSASYNIGARYFIRETLKPLPAKVRSQLEAKVPEAGRRTSCTLSTLWQLTAAMAV